MSIKVIGLDIHPSSPSWVYNGKSFIPLKIKQLQAFLKELTEKKSCLICCDAPLTGPVASPIHTDKKNAPNSMVKREIEAFFTRKNGYNVRETNGKTRLYPGINVSNYSALPHWTITRHLFGLPIVGDYDLEQESLPFKKVHARPHSPGHFITEVHPTLAIWIWLKDTEKDELFQWKYKGKVKSEESARRVKAIINLLSNLPVINSHQIPPELNVSKADKNIADQLDAFIAWLLGKLWLEGNGEIEILGNDQTGSFLLPNKKELFQKWKSLIN